MLRGFREGDPPLLAPGTWGATEHEAAPADREEAGDAGKLGAGKQGTGKQGTGKQGAGEDAKVKGAVRTDFILSAEIIAITLGTVATQPLPTRATVMAVIAIVMTIGVYGLVGAIVKIDDLGLWLSRKTGILRTVGRGLLSSAPYLMKFLSIAGTIAMFLVGGGIISHGIPGIHHFIEHLEVPHVELPGADAVVGALTPMLMNMLVGLAAGAIVFVVVSVGGRLFGSGSKTAPAH